MMKKTILAVIIVLAILLGLNWAAPHLAAYGLYRGLARHMDLQPDAVQVQADPGLIVLLGRMDSVRAGGENFYVGKLRFKTFDASLEHVQFSPLDSLLSGRVQAEQADDGELTATITGEDLRDYLKKQVKGTDGLEITMAENEVHVRGKIKVKGLLKADADIRGRFGMDGTKLMFIPSQADLSAKGVRISAANLVSFEVYDFADFPLGIVPDRITTENDMLILHGRVSRP